MKQAPTTKTDWTSHELNLDIPPAELLVHLEAKHWPLTEEELYCVRKFIIERIYETYGGTIDLGIDLNINQIEVERTLLEDEIHPRFDESSDEKGMVQHDPRELLITDLILDFIISHKFNYELRTLRVGEEYGNLDRWQWMGYMDDISITLDAIRNNMEHKDWLERTKDELWHKYPPKSHPDFDFLMNYLRKMAEKNTDTPSKTWKTRKKVGNILDKKK